MNGKEAEEFRQRVLASDGRAKRVRTEALARLAQNSSRDLRLSQMSLDQFKVISDWHHFAILELTKVAGFRSSPAWIGRKLEVSTYEAKLAVERLVRLGLLKKKARRLEPTHGALVSGNGAPSEAVRRYHRQLLDKAKQAVSRQTVGERDISALTFALRRSDVPLVAEKIRKFRREINEEFERLVPAGSAEEVYGLSFQLFRLTNKETK
jgi:uncharacterized protein (TIGR02147 family)